MSRLRAVVPIIAIFAASNAVGDRILNAIAKTENVVDFLKPLDVGVCDLLYSYAGLVPAAAMLDSGEFAANSMISAVKLPTIENSNGTYSLALTFGTQGIPYGPAATATPGKRGDRYMLIHIFGRRENESLCAADGKFTESRVEISEKLFQEIQDAWTAVLLRTHYGPPPKASIGNVGGARYTFVVSSNDYYRLAGSVDNPTGGIVYDLVQVAVSLKAIAIAKSKISDKVEADLISKLTNIKGKAASLSSPSPLR